jgi:uncharacterized Zn-finger protein
MTMTIDHQRQFGALSFDHMPYSNTPQFTNPWTTTTTTSGPAPNSNPYAPSISPNLALTNLGKQPATRVKNEYMPYNTVPIAATTDLMNTNRMQNSTATYVNDAASYSNAPSPAHSYASSAPYESMGYVPAPVRSSQFSLQPPAQADNQRRLSQPSLLNSNDTRSFGDAIDASRGMIAMSQNTTPRNIYGPNASSGRTNRDSYGFPSTHSSSSSISSSSYQPSYFSGSVDSSVSDYSNAGSDIESTSSRTLPRPNGLINGGIPPAPQSMMGQFSSKISSSTQKKHKCKVCDKRFTRPSSLQTHMYSHTGEKPFSCEVEGCGRNFSVVSNLRRHRKVHKGEARSDAGSEDRQSMETD